MNPYAPKALLTLTAEGQIILQLLWAWQAHRFFISWDFFYSNTKPTLKTQTQSKKTLLSLVNRKNLEFKELLARFASSWGRASCHWPLSASWNWRSTKRRRHPSASADFCLRVPHLWSQNRMFCFVHFLCIWCRSGSYCNMTWRILWIARRVKETYLQIDDFQVASLPLPIPENASLQTLACTGYKRCLLLCMLPGDD